MKIPARIVTAIAVGLLGAACVPAQGQEITRSVKVGVFSVDPIVSLDDRGRPEGFYVDLIREIAGSQGWELEFVPGTWNQGLERLAAGRIDLMTSVAYTAERTGIVEYGEEAVLTLWGQVFARPQRGPQSILDLDGKLVAVTKGDINGLNFRATAERFGVRCRYLEMPSHEEVFRCVRDWGADAGVAPNVFGLKHAAEFRLAGTPIIFEPIATHFAAPLGRNRELLRAIDDRLRQWKQDPESYYYQSLEHWFGGQEFDRRGLSPWLIGLAAGAALLALLLTLWNRALQRKFRSQTRRLRESEEKLRTVFDQSYQLIGLLDPQGTLLDVNQTALDFVGATAREVIGKPFWETPWWSHSPVSQAILRQGIATAAAGEFFRAETTHPGADGDIHYVDFSIKCVKDAGGRVALLVPEGRDVTEHKKNAQQLARLGQAVEQTAEIVIITDTAGVIDYVNPSFERVTGYSRQETLGRSIRFLRPAGLGDRNFERMWQTIEAGASWRGLVTNRKQDGSVFDAEVTVSPILDPQGGTFATVLVWRDVTEIQRLQEDLRQAQKLDAIGTLAAGIAHDFNNILSAIFGYTELALLSVPAADPASEYLQEVMVGAERARELVQQILTFGRRTAPQIMPVPMAPVVKEALKLIRSSIPATIDIQEEVLADGSVLADTSQLHQVVMNLCTNAYQAMEETGGILRVVLKDVDARPGDSRRADPVDGRQGGRYVLLEVGDTGSGMDQATQEKIFEPYFTTKEPGKGTGLGLAVVHGIVKSHNGWITMATEKGRGTTFQVWLPRYAEAGDSVAGRVAETPRPAGSGRILFVDDEAGLVRLAEEYFTARGYRISAFTGAEAALQVLAGDPQGFDVLVTDQTMPRLTGLELAHAALALRPDLPIILCTGYSAVVDRDRAAAAGIRHFAQKPLVMSELAARVGEVLTAARAWPDHPAAGLGPES